jgi:hypothetical protein
MRGERVLCSIGAVRLTTRADFKSSRSATDRHHRHYEGKAQNYVWIKVEMVGWGDMIGMARNQLAHWEVRLS